MAVSAAAAGLSAETTYHFRLVAEGAAGTGDSQDGTFTTLPEPPSVTGVQPRAGLLAGGTEVTITGVRFDQATAVSFGEHQASSFKVLSPTSITAVAPAGTGTVDVHVTNPGGTSAPLPADRFMYVAVDKAPTITAVEPATGPAAGATTVTITGKRLAGTTSVMFGAAAASFTGVSATVVEAVTPAQAPGTVAVTLTTPNGDSAASKKARFTYTEAAAGAVPDAGVDRPSRFAGPLETLW